MIEIASFCRNGMKAPSPRGGQIQYWGQLLKCQPDCCRASANSVFIWAAVGQKSFCNSGQLYCVCQGKLSRAFWIAKRQTLPLHLCAKAAVGRGVLHSLAAHPRIICLSSQGHACNSSVHIRRMTLQGAALPFTCWQRLYPTGSILGLVSFWMKIY